MIKLNYFVHFVAFQMGSGQGRLGSCPCLCGVCTPPLPTPPASKLLAPPFVCRGSVRPRKENEEGKVRNAFYKAFAQVFQAPLLHPSSFLPPTFICKSIRRKRKGRKDLKKNNGLGGMGSAAVMLGTTLALGQGKSG